MNGWICAQTRKQAGFERGFFGPCLWDCEQKRRVVFDPPRATLSSGPPESSGLASGSVLTPDLSPLHGRTVWRESSLHSQLANYPSVLLSESSPWCMKKGRTTHYNRRVLKKKQTNKKTPSQHLSSLQRQSFRYSIILKKKKKR